MKRKSFGISNTLSKGLSDTIKAVKNNAGALRYEVIPLSRMEIDPKNPRTLAVTPQDIEDGLKRDDPQYEVKKGELEGLNRLGKTIKNGGLINAVVVYKNQNKYRLVAGERRYLASLSIGKEDIQARVYEEEPSEDDLRLIQWIENTEREDLSLQDRLGNIRAIVSGYQGTHPGSEVTATVLKDILFVSLPQASNYLVLSNASPDVLKKVKAGKINSVEKGAFIARIKDRSFRECLIKACEEGAPLRKLQSTLSTLKSQKAEKEAQKAPGQRRVGKPLTRINLGVTRNPDVVKKVVMSVLGQREYKKYASSFDQVQWEKFEEANVAFKKMIEFLEIENAK